MHDESRPPREVPPPDDAARRACWGHAAPAGLRAAGERPRWLAASSLLVVVCTAALFWPAGGHEFLAYDDVVYVTANPRVRAGLSLDNLRWALTATDTAVNWHPLTWLVHMLDVELFGLDPRGHHLASVAWHALAAVLFFLCLVRLVGRTGPALFGALAFALHPLRVEAVAMVADRKDLVAGCAGAVSLLCFLAWLRRGGSARYLGALGAYALGLCAKPTLLTWFLVLALVARAYPPAAPVSRRGTAPAPRSRLAPLVPFALLALAAAVPTLVAQARGGALDAAGAIPPGARLANALAALPAYLADTVWPSGLAFFYPHPALVPGGSLPTAAALGGAALVALLTWFALAARARGVSGVPVGWGWFLVTLAPTLGLVQVGLAARADRYTYLPAVGLSLALAAWLARRPAPERSTLRAARVLTAVVVLGLLSLATRRQLASWKDTTALNLRALAVTEHNFLAHANLSSQLQREGRLHEALEQLEASLAIRPGVPALQLSAAELALRCGRPERALAHYREVVALDPDQVGSRTALAGLLAAQGDERGAARELERVVATAPEPQRAAAARALAWILATSPDEALRDGARAADLAAGSLRTARTFEALDALAAALAELGRHSEAERLVGEALTLAPPDARPALEARRAAYAAGQAWIRGPRPGAPGSGAR